MVQIAKIHSNTLSLRSPSILKPFNAMIHCQSGPGEGWIFSIVDCIFLQCSWTVLLKFWKFCIHDEQVLRAVQPICDEDVVLGQYEGYKDDPTVPKDSSTPTFASIILRIKNERWDGRMPELTLYFSWLPIDIIDTGSFKERSGWMFVRCWSTFCRCAICHESRQGLGFKESWNPCAVQRCSWWYFQV